MSDLFHVLARAEALRRKLAKEHGVRGRDLAQSAARARGILPRADRRAAQIFAGLAEAQGHPKRARCVDVADLTGRLDRMEAALDAVDVQDRRVTARLVLAAELSTRLLLVAMGFVIWLLWRGYV